MLTRFWMSVPGEMLTAPAGHVMLDCGPGVDGAGGGAPGVYVTVTENPQVAVCPSLDRAVITTGVVPTGKLLPEAGVPLTVTGGLPPDVLAP
jgi:hypothetical protein